MSSLNSTPATVRFSPSPTGLFHLGSARTALFNFLAARSTNGTFILRCDDTDVARNKVEYTKIIFDSLEWLGLEHDRLEFQSANIQEYQHHAMNLLKAGKAMELDNGAIALIVPDNLPISFTDTISGIIPITNTNKEQIAKIILLRGQTLFDIEQQEGSNIKLDISGRYHSPTYQFASVVDDYFMNIDWIIRGHDHITNTPKQIAIWQQLANTETLNLKEKYNILSGSYRLPQFTHVGLIHKDNKKLSKRDNAASLLWYRDNGYSPKAVLNFILRMGWGSKEDNNQPLSLAEMIDIFPKGRMRAAPSNYDFNKLQWYQKKC